MDRKKKVVFLADVEKVAKKGEIKEVGETFIKNFLLPKQKALIYNEAISKRLEYQKMKSEEQQFLREVEEKRVFTTINNEKLNFFLEERNDKVFGSVTNLDITKALKKKFNIQIDKNSILNFKPLREKGEFLVVVKTGRNLSAKLRIVVNSLQEKQANEKRRRNKN